MLQRHYTALYPKPGKRQMSAGPAVVADMQVIRVRCRVQGKHRIPRFPLIENRMVARGLDRYGTMKTSNARKRTRADGEYVNELL